LGKTGKWGTKKVLSDSVRAQIGKLQKHAAVLGVSEGENKNCFPPTLAEKAKVSAQSLMTKLRASLPKFSTHIKGK